jgi:hypothetical protein
LAALVLTVLLGLVGYLSESERTILGRHIRFDIYGVPTVVSEQH